MATVDADTLLMPAALKRVVARLLISPPDTVAVAGAVFVRNSRRNFITRAQEWDYFLGIASVKRQQGLFQGTMVAQGAFSVYRTAALQEVGGWPDRIGEDIVLTWAMMRKGGRVGYERTAIAFTSAPEGTRAFARQRRRWARGMIEGLREHGGALLVGGRSNVHAVLVNFVFPYVDVVFSIAFPIGIVLALCGNFAIVGPMTLAVLPLNVALSMIMFHLSKQSFGEVGLRVRQNRLGYLGYLFTYQLFMSPVPWPATRRSCLAPHAAGSPLVYLAATGGRCAPLRRSRPAKKTLTKRVARNMVVLEKCLVLWGNCRI